MKIRLSVILPVYNGADTLEIAIRSVLSQSYKDLELFITDDGSSDKPLEVIKSFSDSRINFIQQRHRGLAKTLNYMLSLASGEYVARMDADDICLPERFYSQVNLLDANPEIGLVAGVVGTSEYSKSEGLLHYINWQNKIISPEDIYHNRFVDSPVIHPTVMFRKSIYHEFGGYNEGDVPEDYELWLRWMSQGVRMTKIDKPVLKWNDSPSRLTRANKNYNRAKFFEIKALYFSKWFRYKFKTNQPEIWICGSGSKVFQRTSLLEKNGLTIAGFIDFNRRVSLRQVITYDDIKSLNNPFLLSYVSDRFGRINIHDYLTKLGMKEGTDFYMMA